MPSPGRALWTESPVAWEERSFCPWSDSTSCRCCGTVSKPMDCLCSFSSLSARTSDQPLCSPLADWKYRHAGLMALSAIGEGCHQQMEAILQEIVSFVLLFCEDQVPIASSELERSSADQFFSKRPMSEDLQTPLDCVWLLLPSSAPKGPLRCLQCHWTNGHRLCPNLPEEIPQ